MLQQQGELILKADHEIGQQVHLALPAMDHMAIWTIDATVRYRGTWQRQAQTETETERIDRRTRGGSAMCVCVCVCVVGAIRPSLQLLVLCSALLQGHTGQWAAGRGQRAAGSGSTVAQT